MPPERLSLTWSTPFSICSRMARTKPIGPSQVLANPVPSAWPAVVVRNQPPAKIRGPTSRPPAYARLRATSMKWGTPAVRMAVTPDSTSPRVAFAAYCTVSSATVAAGSRGHSRCTWTSQRPGSR